MRTAVPLINFLRNAASSPLVVNNARQPQKITKAHQRHIDEKCMFGGVVELQKEKKKRERSEKKEKVFPTINQEEIDSEAFWVTKSSKNVRTIKRKGNHDLMIGANSAEKNTEPDNAEQPCPPSNQPLFMPEILVKNMTSMPLFTREHPCIDTNEHKFYPSVTRVLTETMSNASRAALERWKQKMIAELGEEGFIEFNQAQLSFGARFHSLVRSHLDGQQVKVEKDLEAVWTSVQPAITRITNVTHLESYVHHPTLKYKGYVDCVASYEETPCVIEWKVSEKLKPTLSSTFDAPLQLTAYLGALAQNSTKPVTTGLVVVCYKNGSPAQVFPMPEGLCNLKWRSWLERLQTYWMNYNSKEVTEGR